MKFIDNTSLIKEQLKDQIKKALVELGGTAENKAKRLVAVDTGLLRANIVFDINEKEKFARVGVLAETAFDKDGNKTTIKKPLNYVIDQEYGNSRQSGKPFIRPAKEEVQGKAVEIVAKHLKKVGK